jgi:hypothetical protein
MQPSNAESGERINQLLPADGWKAGLYCKDDFDPKNPEPTVDSVLLVIPVAFWVLSMTRDSQFHVHAAIIEDGEMSYVDMADHYVLIPPGKDEGEVRKSVLEEICHRRLGKKKNAK